MYMIRISITIILVFLYTANVSAQSNCEQCEIKIVNTYPEIIKVTLEADNGRRICVFTGTHGFDFAPGESITITVPTGDYCVLMFSKKSKCMLKKSEKISIRKTKSVPLAFFCSDKPAPCSYEISVNDRTIDPEITVKFSTPIFPYSCVDSFVIMQNDEETILPICQYWADASTMIIHPRYELKPNTTYKVRSINLTPVNMYGVNISEIKELIFETGCTSKRLDCISNCDITWSGPVVTIEWDKIADAEGYRIHDTTQKNKYVDIKENRWSYEFPSTSRKPLLIVIDPYYSNQEYKKILSERPKELTIYNLHRQKKDLEETFPLGGIMVGLIFGVSQDNYSPDTVRGIDAMFQIPIGIEYLGAYTDAQFMPDDNTQNVSGSLGFRACIPFKNSLLRFESFVHCGYFILYEASTETFFRFDTERNAIIHGPEITLGVRANVRPIGLFLAYRERLEGLYDHVPEMHPYISMGVDWSFIPRYW